MRENEIGQYNEEFVWIVVGGAFAAIVVVVCVFVIAFDIISVAKFTASPAAAFTEEMLSKIK